ncbi:hypothetical protein KAR91_36510 [Candidatus Pacearchaeota archaeon]|nr:hypothetical protein [Candidatus Pacearchaeota archaeon]
MEPKQIKNIKKWWNWIKIHPVKAVLYFIGSLFVVCIVTPIIIGFCSEIGKQLADQPLFSKSSSSSYNQCVFISITTSKSIDNLNLKDIEYDKSQKADILKQPTPTKVKDDSKNNIKNGMFHIPLYSKDNPWGHGYYSDKFRRYNPGLNFSWINFLNAEINISIEKTKNGQAMKIDNKSGHIPNKIGIMEQSIKVTPGKYRFSFWAKANNLEKNALQFSTVKEWHTVDPKTKIVRGYELTKGGTFDWKNFSDVIQIDKAEEITFTIISSRKGIVYITGLELVKIFKP